MAIDANSKYPQSSPQKRKKAHPLTWQLRSRVRICEAVAAALRVGSSPEVPSAIGSCVTTSFQMQQVEGYGRIRDCFQEVKTQKLAEARVRNVETSHSWKSQR